MYAESLGIDIKRISIELRGTQDLRGFMGLDETIPPGFMEIEGEVRIDSSAAATELEELQKLVDNHCPVLDDLTRNLPVKLTLK